MHTLNIAVNYVTIFTLHYMTLHYDTETYVLTYIHTYIHTQLHTDIYAYLHTSTDAFTILVEVQSKQEASLMITWLGQSALTDTTVSPEVLESTTTSACEMLLSLRQSRLLRQ